MRFADTPRAKAMWDMGWNEPPLPTPSPAQIVRLRAALGTDKPIRAERRAA